LFNAFLKEKKIDLGKAFEITMPRVFTFFKMSLLVAALAVLAVGALLVVPLLLIVSNPSPAMALPVVLLFLIISLILMLAMLLLMPFFALLAPVAFFEKLGAIDGLKRAFALIKTNYLGNLAFVFVYFLVMFGVSWIVNTFVQFAMVFPMVSMISGSPGANLAAFVGAWIVFGIIAFLIYIPYVVWTSVFETAAFRNLYFLDVQRLQKPLKRRKRKAK